jgi:hypothetical protein
MSGGFGRRNINHRRNDMDDQTIESSLGPYARIGYLEGQLIIVQASLEKCREQLEKALARARKAEERVQELEDNR